MRAIPVVFLIAMAVFGQAQQTTDRFTSLPGEHIINQIAEPIVVRSVKGHIHRAQGDNGPLAGVLFELQGPATNLRIMRVKTDGRGRFKIGHMAVGAYKFKLSLYGFQSVIGDIVVSEKAPETAEIDLNMLVGV